MIEKNRYNITRDKFYQYENARYGGLNMAQENINEIILVTRLSTKQILYIQKHHEIYNKDWNYLRHLDER